MVWHRLGHTKIFETFIQAKDIINRRVLQWWDADFSSNILNFSILHMQMVFIEIIQGYLKAAEISSTGCKY